MILSRSGIDGGRDVVRDLARGVAQAHAIVEGCGPDPERPAGLVQLVAAPETDMMPPPRIDADGLLEGQVLLAPEEEKAAHRGVVIGPMEDRSGRDPQGAPERDGVGRKPLGGEHRPLDVLFTAHQGDVHRIARDVVAGPRDPGSAVQGRDDGVRSGARRAAAANRRQTARRASPPPRSERRRASQRPPRMRGNTILGDWFVGGHAEKTSCEEFAGTHATQPALPRAYSCGSPIWRR